MKNHPIYFYGLLLVPILLAGCLKDDFRKLKNPDWQPEVALPIAYGTYTLEDLLSYIPDSQFVSSDTNSVIVVSYAGELFDFVGSDLVDLWDIPYFFVGDSIAIPIPSTNGNVLTQLTFKSGQLSYNFSLISQEDVTVRLTIPDAVFSNGNAFVQEFPLVYQGDSIFQVDGSIDLEEVTINLPLDSLNNSLFRMKYEAFTTANQEDVSVQTFFGEFQNLAFRYLEGYFGFQQLGFGIDTIYTAAFGPWRDGVLYLDDPRITINFHNSIGLPIFGSLSNIRFTQNLRNFNLTGTVFQDSVLISFPGIDSAGFVDSTKLLIDRSNSNIRNGIGISPQQMSVSMDLYARSEPDFSQLNFAFDTSRLNISYALEVPLAIRMEEVHVADTFDIQGETYDEVDYVDFLIISENSLPMSLDFQGYFLDYQYNILDSLFEDEPRILEAAITNDQGFVIQSAPFTANLRVDGEKLRAFSQTQYLLLDARVTTSEDAQKTIRLTTDNQLFLSLSAKAGLNP